MRERIPLGRVARDMGDTKRSREDQGKNKEQWRREQDIEETMESEDEPEPEADENEETEE